MLLIAGLGNPGKQYEKTRHNMGFDVVDELIDRHEIPQAGIAHKALYGNNRKDPCTRGSCPVIFMRDCGHYPDAVQ